MATTRHCNVPACELQAACAHVTPAATDGASDTSGISIPPRIHAASAPGSPNRGDAGSESVGAKIARKKAEAAAAAAAAAAATTVPAAAESNLHTALASDSSAAPLPLGLHPLSFAHCILNPPMQNQPVTTAAAASSGGSLAACVSSSEISSSFRVFVGSCENLSLPSPDAFAAESTQATADDSKEVLWDAGGAGSSASGGGAAMFGGVRARSDSDSALLPGKSGGGAASGAAVVLMKIDLRCGSTQLAPAVTTAAVPFSRHPVWGAWITMTASVSDLPPGCVVSCEVVARWPEKGGGEVSLGSGRLALFAPFYLQQGNVEVVVNTGPAAAAAAAAGGAAAAAACAHLCLQRFNFAVVHAAAMQGVTDVCIAHDTITKFKERRSIQPIPQQPQQCSEQQHISSLGALYRHSPVLHPPPPPSPHEWLLILNLVESAMSLSSAAAAAPSPPCLSADDHGYIWLHRLSILGVSHALVAVVQSAPWLTPHCITELYNLLPQWSPMSDSLLLLLLLGDITDIVVRTWACLRLSTLPLTRLHLFVPALISVLRHEPVAGANVALDLQP